MAILIIAATSAEVDNVANKLPKDAHTLITGVGSVATCYSLMKILNLTKFDLLIQAGFAGSFNDHHLPGQVYTIYKDSFGDLGMEENDNFVPLFNTTFADADEFPFANGWLINQALQTLTSLNNSATAVTINKITDSILQKNQLLDNFNPDLESMEGAAFHYVAIQQKIPFIQIRAVTNFVGDRNKSNWKIREAKENLGIALVEIVEEYLNKN